MGRDKKVVGALALLSHRLIVFSLRWRVTGAITTAAVNKELKAIVV